MPSKPQHYVIEMLMVGGRGGTRTRGPLLAKQIPGFIEIYEIPWL
jgi:hypothetical protein